MKAHMKGTCSLLFRQMLRTSRIWQLMGAFGVKVLLLPSSLQVVHRALPLLCASDKLIYSSCNARACQL